MLLTGNAAETLSRSELATNKRPVIALPGYPLKKGRVDGWVTPGVAVPQPYLEAVARAGGEGCVLLPRSISAAEADEIVSSFDGLMLLGGGDVDPANYGEERGERTYGVIRVRDEFEIALLDAATRSSLPVFGVCRGAQILAVARGGTLMQHITDMPGVEGHGIPGVESGAQLHEIFINQESRLAEILQVDAVTASCHHHQAVRDVPEGLRVSASSPDGVIEAIESTSEHFCIAVQWHPEDTAATDPNQQRLFDAFVQACK